MFKSNIVFLLILVSIKAIGQLKTDNDSTSLVSYVDKIIIKANINTQTDTYFFIDKNDNTKALLVPNDNVKLFLSLDYEFIGLSLGFTPNFFLKTLMRT